MGTYIIGTTDNKFIKIGKSKNIEKRLTGIQVGCPLELQILAWYPDIDMEDHLHELFQDVRVRGDWFFACPKVDKFIYEFKPVHSEASIKKRKGLDYYMRHPLESH